MPIICCRGLDKKHCQKCQDTGVNGIKFRSGLPIPVNCKWLIQVPQVQQVISKVEPSIKKYENLKVSRPITFDQIIPLVQLHGTDHDKKECTMVQNEIAICKCKNKYPRTQQRLIADYRKYIKPRVLIVGNANVPLTANLRDYDDIVIFNKPRKMELLSWASYHFMRTYNTNLQHHSGEEYIDSHYAKPIFVESGEGGRRLMQKYKDRKPELFSCRNHIDYPKDSTPSTGIAVINYFLKRNFEVDIECFTWVGNKGHNWKWEKDYCNQLKNDNKIRILTQEI